MKKPSLFNAICLLVVMYVCTAFLLHFRAFAASAGNLNATVKQSVCGNYIAEDGEDCDNADWAARTCTNLGYAGGTLACTIACTFDTSGCSIYLIDPQAVLPEQVPSLYASGFLTKPPTEIMTAVSSLTSTTDITTLIPTGSGSDSAITIPASSTLFRLNNGKFDPTQLSAALINASLVQGFPGNAVVEQAFSWGISGTTVAFTAPVTVRAYVGPTLDGQTLYVYRSESLTSGWGTTGMIAPATCTVTDGVCEFQSIETSYFAIVRYILPTPTPTSAVLPTSTPAPTAVPSSTIGPSATPAPAQSMAQPEPVPFWQQLLSRPQTIIPQVIRVFYADEAGKIGIGNIFTAVKTWVDSWREILAVDIYGKKDTGGIVAQNKVKCDINNDGQCDLTDLSVLLYYVGK